MLPSERTSGASAASRGGREKGSAETPQTSSDDNQVIPVMGSGSELPGFYRLPLSKRRSLVKKLCGLSLDDLRVLSGEAGLCDEQADHMVENALGFTALPLGVCVNLKVNDRDRLVPMAVEEASVIAAASHAAKLLRAGGGVRTEVSAPRMIGQIQLLDVPNPQAAEAAILAVKDEFLAQANTTDACLVQSGGGAVDLEVHHLPPMATDDPLGAMLVVHLIVDVRDAMGANTVNTMCEHLAPRMAELAGGRVLLRIVSNLADQRTVTAYGTVPLSVLADKGCDTAEQLARNIEAASVFADRDPYRAATHNKGVMNGVDGVLLAFGQDWRAVEAGAHAFAAREGRYTALGSWRVRDGALHGRLELPMPVGVVGGATWAHPTCRVVRRIAGVTDAADLASLTAAVGLAQNLGALRALAAEGIQQGHMRVHARNVAVAAGAVGREVDTIAKEISRAQSVSLDSARKALTSSRVSAPSVRDAAQMRDRFTALRETYVERMMKLIRDILGRSTPENSSLLEMCEYHMSSGGKRIRALLPLLVAETLGFDAERLVPFGSACEMLHNATLVHDDLQDGDRLRRGVETIWFRYGVPQAINLGDAMFYYCLLLLQRVDVPLARREEVARRVMEETLRVIDGQEKEFLLKQQEQPDAGDYFNMVEGKTSGLFALPMAGAAVLCGAGDKVVNGLMEAARHMGVLFQIQDDLLDLYGHKGRGARGGDIREGKRSMLVVHALANADEEDAAWLLEVLSKDRKLNTPEEIEQAMALFDRAGSLDAALDEIETRKQRAVSVFNRQEQAPLATLMEAMCDLYLEPISAFIETRKV